MRNLTVFTILFLLVALLPNSALSAQNSASSKGLAPVEQTFDALPFNVCNTKVRLITDNVEAWYARWNVISQAKKTIDTTYFILAHDIYGDSFLGLLLKKARDGVKVRLMIDARGSQFFSQKMSGGQDFVQELVEAGAEVKVFNPIHRNLPKLPFNLKYVISSNHDKIVIVDSNLVITGGRNISKDYFADVRDDPTVFRDTDVLMEGSDIATSMKMAFDEEFTSLKNYTINKEWLGNWSSKRKYLVLAGMAMNRWINGQGLYTKKVGDFDPTMFNSELELYKNSTWYSSYRPFHGDRVSPIKILDKHSIAGDRNDITGSIIKLMDSCQEEIIIQNPYVILTKQVWEALIRAGKRGVKVIIHTNSPVSSDSLLTQAFFLNDWKKVLKLIPNSEIWAFVGVRKLHAKIFVFDRKVATVGTYNMDAMSESINSEVMACIKSRTFATRSALRTMEDIKDSRQFTIRMTTEGEAVEVFGPASLAKGKLKALLEILRHLNFLRPLI
ncbi:MAG: hypothetical protein CVV64_10245 [Candidatus Wallbacteria bacterium HGW-Wallbacteria-1]|jgi:phosphatidylserine/phosphatidylglycerophosphate/cardiolipin synthase-like enzyme|uniref:PLD phosphodiesterase domain-containing protein n=1 Tax=Candidatus Wallbacteria bacterium HGW-Wallbacteria-1 TaxID=2013854 RepID=A0A2N1PPS3_9BACT|nr:MAG: hypothetical protein CVV64_10245 [Candidatus Wallbacteria bacterium HGW-Wallbacteria-1]